tara:strand:+ start:597 stop:1466 length:870 start_codon:yes stop_codon:yes gene_type:complete
LGAKKLELTPKQYERIITFGCSWTEFLWPTWANVISDILEVPLFNQGGSGEGNVAILHKMLAWKLQCGFHNTDLVLVNWSNFMREDRIKNGSWKTGGNVATSRFYNDKFVRNYWDEENDFVKNAGAMIMANEMFDIAYQSRIPSQNNYDSKKSAPWYNKWQKEISHIKYFELLENEEDWYKLTSDLHPSILSHIHHAVKIAKHLRFKDTDRLNKVKTAYTDLHDNIVNDLKIVSPKTISLANTNFGSKAGFVFKFVPIAVAKNLKKLNMPPDFQGYDRHLRLESWHDLC